jgi:hypothetical protein
MSELVAATVVPFWFRCCFSTLRGRRRSDWSRSVFDYSLTFPEALRLLTSFSVKKTRLL